MMKKLFFILLCVAVAIPALGQRGGFGVKAGTNYSTVHAAGLEGINGKAGFVAGVFGELGRGPVTLQAEILYSREGYNVEDQNLHDLNVSFNYLNIPLLIKIYPLSWLSLDLGYQTGVLWNTAVKNTSDFQIGEIEKEFSGTRSINNSLVMGLTFRFWGHFDLSARYNLGFSDLINKTEGEMLRSRVGQFTLGYRF